MELVLALPLLAALALALLQVALIGRDQLRVVHAAREAARQAAVDGDRAAIRASALEAASLEPGRTVVVVPSRGPAGGHVTIEVRYRAATDVPVVGALVGDVALRATTSMRVER